MLTISSDCLWGACSRRRVAGEVAIVYSVLKLNDDDDDDNGMKLIKFTVPFNPLKPSGAKWLHLRASKTSNVLTHHFFNF